LTKQREILELLSEQPVIPDGDFGEPVVGDSEGTGLLRSEMIEAQRRHLSQTELAAGGEATVAANYVVVAINQDRDIEAEGLDAVGDLPDLLLAVPARVVGIRFELVDRPVDDQHPRRKAGRLAVRSAKVLRQRGKLPSILRHTPRHCGS
jgi:hypothetical protein